MVGSCTAILLVKFAMIPVENDGMYSCCPAGEVCFDLMSLLMGGGMGGMPGMPEEMGVLFGYCSCNKGTCLGGGTCTPLLWHV